jgi:hypothetical protein
MFPDYQFCAFFSGDYFFFLLGNTVCYSGTAGPSMFLVPTPSVFLEGSAGRSRLEHLTAPDTLQKY